MVNISEEEKLRRRQVNASVLGTTAMEGQFLDLPTLALLRQFEEGELDREQLSAAINLHVAELVAETRRTVSEETVQTTVGVA